MVLWRLAGKKRAKAFDGGYGLLYDGRWNSAGRAVTYCATSPSLCVLEKLVHVQDPELLPELMMVRYAIPDGTDVDTIELDALPASWRSEESLTQRLGDRWHAALASPLLRVPSAIVPLAGSPDANVLINHRHPAVGDVTIAKVEPFALDARLL